MRGSASRRRSVRARATAIAALLLTAFVLVPARPAAAVGPADVIGQPTRAGTTTATACAGANAHFNTFEDATVIGVAVGANRRVYATDYGGNRVLTWPDLDAMSSCQSADAVIGTAAGSGLITGHPEAVAVDSVGNVYVADTRANDVKIYNRNANGTYSYLHTLGSGTGGTANDQMINPRGLAINAAGRLYVADDYNSRISWFDHPLTETTPDGFIDQSNCHVILAYNPPPAAPCVGNGTPGVDGPDLKGLALIGHYLFITNYTIGRVVRVDEPTADLPISTFDRLHPRVLPGAVHPIDLTGGPDGYLYVTDHNDYVHSRVLVYDTPTTSFGIAGPDSTITADLGPSPFGVATDAKNIAIADSGQDRVLIDPLAANKPALLRISTSPAVPADIFVDGIQRNTWALSWVQLPVGEHQVCFGAVPDWQSPPCVVLDLSSGSTTQYLGTFVAYSHVHVTTSPPVQSTITFNGVPVNDWGAWTSVAPSVNLSICFGKVPGYDPPPCYGIDTGQGVDWNFTGTFTPNPAATGPSEPHGMLRAVTDPPEQAVIQVDGVDRNTWGLEWLKLPVGTHQVCFGPAFNATAPASCNPANITDGGTVTLTGTYAPKGFLHVVTDPPVAANIIVNGEVADAWGIWVDKAPGSYDVCFGDVPGHVTPPCQNNVVVAAGATSTVTGTYTTG